ncbi:MAG TPA: KamA family radical SAM protein [Bacteroidales bacterium]|nr:KamA family radical SAM protein [Bacteroidales bacterium]HOK73861.1 KamA family radical SAM protein [Bacteroidales bacterium]HOU31666.1 KamA family radical SAM protein [Bacteroidales bacterium]HPP91659.1 KamA family radical SAM protein [Bacteroidales bacterium]
MNANNNEASAFHGEGRLKGCSSDEEPGAKAVILSQVETPVQIVSNRNADFIHRYFPLATNEQWNDWKWQLRNAITTLEDLRKIMPLTEKEIMAIKHLKGRLPLRITPYFASLIHNTKPGNPLRRIVIPVVEELIQLPVEKPDPLHEEAYSPVKGIVHRYPDRVLFTVTQVCSAYCRYCTRSHSVGKLDKLGKNDFEKAFDYIRNHTEIRDVLVSGGDPLTMSDEMLDYILKNIRNIPHVEIIRIGTRVPVVLPQRITDKLIATMRKYHPLYISLHFSHPDEITDECAQACNKLADGGFPLGSQTVLLKGINDNVEIMKKLFHKLLMIRVRPYYLYQCDLIPGSGHFRTSIRKGLEIIKGLRGYTSGYAIPQFVVDAPGGGGKIPLLPDYVVAHTKEKIVLRNYKGMICEYPEI